MLGVAGALALTGYNAEATAQSATAGTRSSPACEGAASANCARGVTAVPARQLGTILSLGDSITVGHSGGYQRQVSTRLKSAGVSFNGDIVNAGHSGWQMIKCNVNGIYQTLDAELDQYKPDTVLLMIGTNDVGGGNLPGMNLASIGHPEINCSYDQAPQRLNLLIEKIHEKRPTAMVFVANIIPIMRLPISERESEKYAPKVAQLVNKRIAAGDSLIAAVDVWTDFPRETGYQADKVHPTSDGQRFIGDRFFEAIQRWLQGK
jgi:lysophospholipase L1-like esterase